MDGFNAPNNALKTFTRTFLTQSDLARFFGVTHARINQLTAHPWWDENTSTYHPDPRAERILIPDYITINGTPLFSEDRVRLLILMHPSLAAWRTKKAAI